MQHLSHFVGLRAAEMEKLGWVEGHHDRHRENKPAAQFEAAFEAKFTPKRKLPKSYTPTPKAEIPLPWYLHVNGTPPEGESEKP